MYVNQLEQWVTNISEWRLNLCNTFLQWVLKLYNTKSFQRTDFKPPLPELPVSVLGSCCWLWSRHSGRLVTGFSLPRKRFCKGLTLSAMSGLLSRTVARNFSIAGGLDILKFHKNSTDLLCFILQFGGLRPPVAMGLLLSASFYANF